VPRWLVLCERGDHDAEWVFRGLSRRGFDALELVTADDLLGARRWDHRLGAHEPSIEIELSDGRLIDGASVHGVVNRLVAIAPRDVARGAHADREYASQELYAFFLSWLAGLPGRIMNSPSPQGLCGAWLDRSEWLLLAARAGLPTPVFRSAARRLPRRPPGGARRRVIVVGRRALGPPAPAAVVAGCGRLARLSRTAILGVDFRVSAEDQWSFASATPLPALRSGGERLLDLVAAALRDQAPS
jgi:hypothetical protein